jgi:hypothetical protein
MKAMPDIDNNQLRYQEDSLNKYPKNCYDFHQLLRRFNVIAYICGHTHNTSIAKINEIWQIDVGQARGIESFFPDMFVDGLSENDCLRNQYKVTFWENANLARSTFFKIVTGMDKTRIEIYRDDARGGDYSLCHTEILN